MTRIEGAIVCLGEVVWDLFADGPVLGGAPFNSAVHLQRHGAPVALVTAVGRDRLGEEILAFLDGEGLPGARIHPSLPTGTVQVALDGQGTPSFAIREGAAWTDLAGAAARAGEPAPLRPALLVFGGVAMHSAGNRKLATRLGNAAPLRLCDLNLRPGWSDPAVGRWWTPSAPGMPSPPRSPWAWFPPRLRKYSWTGPGPGRPASAPCEARCRSL